MPVTAQMQKANTKSHKKKQRKTAHWLSQLVESATHPPPSRAISIRKTNQHHIFQALHIERKDETKTLCLKTLKKKNSDAICLIEWISSIRLCQVCQSVATIIRFEVKVTPTPELSVGGFQLRNGLSSVEMEFRMLLQSRVILTDCWLYWLYADAVCSHISFSYRWTVNNCQRVCVRCSSQRVRWKHTEQQQGPNILAMR